MFHQKNAPDNALLGSNAPPSASYPAPLVLGKKAANGGDAWRDTTSSTSSTSNAVPTLKDLATLDRAVCSPGKHVTGFAPEMEVVNLTERL